MAPPKIIYSFFLLFLFLHFSNAQDSEQKKDGTDAATSTQTTKPAAGDADTATSTLASCLTEFNSARTAAGLSAFKESSAAITADLEMCNQAQQGLGGYHEKATFFYSTLKDDKEECADAVRQWRSGLAVLNFLPPPVYTENAIIYNDERVLGLVGLFNPKENPTIECKYVTCPLTTTSTTTQAPSTTSGTKPSGQGQESSGVGAGGVPGVGDSDQDSSVSQETESQTQKNGTSEASGAKSRAVPDTPAQGEKAQEFMARSVPGDQPPPEEKDAKSAPPPEPQPEAKEKVVVPENSKKDEEAEAAPAPTTEKSPSSPGDAAAAAPGSGVSPAAAGPATESVSGVSPAAAVEKKEVEGDAEAPPQSVTPAAPAGGSVSSSSDAAAAAGSGAPKDSGVSPAVAVEKKEAAEAPPQTRRLSAQETYRALVCITKPPVLVKGQQPFQKEQWDKIVGAVSAASTATTSVFSLFALAAMTLYIF